MPATDQPRARRRSTRVGPAALVAPDLLGERAAGLPLHHALARTLPQLRPGRSAAASTLGRRCAARWASPSAPAGRWPRADCGYDPHPRGLMASVGTTGAARDKDRPRPHLPRGGVGSRVARSTCGRRQAASCARPCSDIRRRRERILGRIRRAVTESCWGPMRPVRYWSSPPLIRGSARALKTTGGLPASRGALVVRAPRKGPAGIPPVLVISSISSRRV